MCGGFYGGLALGSRGTTEVVSRIYVCRFSNWPNPQNYFCRRYLYGLTDVACMGAVFPHTRTTTIIPRKDIVKNKTKGAEYVFKVWIKIWLNKAIKIIFLWLYLILFTRKDIVEVCLGGLHPVTVNGSNCNQTH